MELKEVIGRRRSMRYLRPYKPVEREKLQKMLEAARLASFWGNVQALTAVVIERASVPPDVVKALPTGTAIGGFQFRLAPVVIVWTLDWMRVEEQGTRLHELVDAGALGINPEKSHAYMDETLIPFFQAATEAIKQAGSPRSIVGRASRRRRSSRTKKDWAPASSGARTTVSSVARSDCPTR